MGLASSQARLLLLTARKSDLEYRAQMISQRKIMLAMATEELATDYTRKLSNRVIKFSFDIDANENKTMDEFLNYQGLTYENTSYIGKYIVTDMYDRMVVPLQENGNPDIPAGFAVKTTADGRAFAVYVGSPDDVPGKNEEFAAMEDSDFLEKYYNNQSENPNGKTTYELSVVQELNNRQMFQNSLRNGALQIHKLNNEGSFNNVAWQNASVFKDALNTEDDPAAQAEYEAKSLQLQNQDKILDLELKQIETQHKAIETEYDSVKQVIQKNIETSFKIFANG